MRYLRMIFTALASLGFFASMGLSWVTLETVSTGPISNPYTYHRVTANSVEFLASGALFLWLTIRGLNKIFRAR